MERVRRVTHVTGYKEDSREIHSSTMRMDEWWRMYGSMKQKIECLIMELGDKKV